MDEDSLGRSTEYQDLGTVFAQLVRVGTVTDVNNDKRIARVKFQDLGYTSDCMNRPLHTLSFAARHSPV